MMEALALLLIPASSRQLRQRHQLKLPKVRPVYMPPPPPFFPTHS